MTSLHRIPEVRFRGRPCTGPISGQGGGAEATTVAPGETKTIEARLLYPGLYMYHCAYGDIPSHISHGMFGGILVDPATPLPGVDHEWYIVQPEYSTASKDPGVVEFDRGAVTKVIVEE